MVISISGIKNAPEKGAVEKGELWKDGKNSEKRKKVL